MSNLNEERQSTELLLNDHRTLVRELITQTFDNGDCDIGSPTEEPILQQLAPLIHYSYLTLDLESVSHGHCSRHLLTPKLQMIGISPRSWAQILSPSRPDSHTKKEHGAGESKWTKFCYLCVVLDGQFHHIITCVLSSITPMAGHRASRALILRTPIALP